MKPLIQTPDPLLDPKNITARLGKDGVGRFHFRSASLESTAADRFSQIQELFLCGKLVLPHLESRIAISLILFDGIVTRDDLVNAIEAADSTYAWRGEYCLDWLDSDGRVNRRFISVFTQAALAAPRIGKVDVATAMTHLGDVLRSCIRGSRMSYSVDLLLLDARAWLAENVSDPLVAHCNRAVPIAALPRSVLAREETKLALGSVQNALHSEDTSEGFARALEAYFDPSGNDQGTWLIAELVQKCRRNRSFSNSDDKQRMLRACMTLSERAADAGPIAGLILAWVIDLIESGTRAKKVLKAITPAKYIAAASSRLLVAFRGKSVEEISAPLFVRIYQEMLAGLSSSQARTLASAIGSWHFFLSCWFDVAPLYVSLHKWLPISPPKANLLWPHELELIRSWIRNPVGEGRMSQQLQIAFEILSNVRIRAMELINLRVCNVQFEGDDVKIEVATHESDGGVKTNAGRRTQTFSSQHASMIIREWLGRRKTEGALPDDYLFGDPYLPERQYRTGALYLTLNKLLKAASGDSSIGTHALSHTRVSFDWLEATSERFIADVNPFERGAVAAGHESAGTGFYYYFHFAEQWLRNELNECIARRLTLWPSVRNHVALSACAFRQNRSRSLKRNSDSPPGEIAFRYIRQAAPYLIVPTANWELVMAEPKNPIVVRDIPSLNLASILNLLFDIWYGYSTKVIALRCGRPAETVLVYADAALAVLELIGEADRHAKDQHGGNRIAALGSIFNGPTGNQIQLKRAGQDKAGYLYSHIDSHPQDYVVETGIESWIRIYQRGFLSLDHPAAAAGFVVLLDAAEYPRPHLVVRGTSKLDLKVKAGITAIFTNEKPVLPAAEIIKHRYGRPRAYLALCSGTPKHGKCNTLANATLGMGGVHAVMFASAVRSRVQKLLATSTSEAHIENQGEQTNG